MTETPFTLPLPLIFQRRKIAKKIAFEENDVFEIVRFFYIFTVFTDKLILFSKLQRKLGVSVLILLYISL